MTKQEGPAIKTFGQVLPGISYIDRPGAYGFIQNEQLDLAVVRTSYGYFLPGGGLDPGEDERTGLAREVREELGFDVLEAKFLMKAAQFHWSEFYRSHFRKIGSFFEVKTDRTDEPRCAPDHALIWLPASEAARQLTQEFQRFAALEFVRLIP